MKQWYAFQSKAGKEELLCDQLRLRQVHIFYPYLRVQPVNPRARKTKPYFPGYVFGQVDLEQAGSTALNWIPGAIGIVNFGGKPVPVADHLIITLQQHLEQINSSHKKKSEIFQPGDAVAIQGGPFAGYEAIFDARLPGRDRVEVLLEMLWGSQIRVVLPIEQIALV
jgi:transcriptional antiterminator RfaH